MNFLNNTNKTILISLYKLIYLLFSLASQLNKLINGAMFRHHWARQQLVLPADELGGCLFSGQTASAMGRVAAATLLILTGSHECLSEVRVAIVAKKENFEHQPVQYHDDDKDSCRANDGYAKLC